MRMINLKMNKDGRVYVFMKSESESFSYYWDEDFNGFIFSIETEANEEPYRMLAKERQSQRLFRFLLSSSTNDLTTYHMIRVFRRVLDWRSVPNAVNDRMVDLLDNLEERNYIGRALLTSTARYNVTVDVSRESKSKYVVGFKDKNLHPRLEPNYAIKCRDSRQLQRLLEIIMTWSNTKINDMVDLRLSKDVMNRNIDELKDLLA